MKYFYDDYSGMPSGAPTWTGTPSKGRLTGVTYGPGSEGTYYKYTAAGSIVTSRQRTGTSNYDTTYTYNRAGAVTREDRGSPARRRNWMSYDAVGRLSLMQTGIYNAFGFEPRDLVREISYTPFGGLQSETYGNELIHTMAYNSRHQPTEIRLGRPDNLESLFRIGYIYGAANNVNGQDAEITAVHNNGNVARIKYLISGAVQYTQTFQYDPLNRIGYAVEHNNGVHNDAARAWYQTFDYDPNGNRGINIAYTSDNVDGANSALQLAEFSAANNRITRAGFFYDAAGNLIAEPGKSYTYDAENRIVTATVAGGVTSQYVYDGNGRRVKKIVGGVGTRFEYGGELIAEWTDADSGRVVQKEYFYKGGALLATSKVGASAQYEYATADHLGSPRAWTDDSGNLIAGGRHDYLPFGEELFAGVGIRTTEQGYATNPQQDGQRIKFDGYERDDETGLDFAEPRYFSSKQGRFTSPDPFLGSAETYEPQSWNRYAFVLNNPLFYIDPTGLKWVQNNQDNRYYWIPDDQWEEASRQTFDNDRQLYTPLKPEQFAFDSEQGRVVLDPRGPNPDNPSGFTVTPQMSAGVIAVGALGTSQIDSPAPGPGDVAAVGLLLYAGYVWMTREIHPLPIINPNIFTSGDRGAGKVNKGRHDAAEKALEKLRDELAKLKSAPNKTSDIKAQIKAIQKQIQKQLDRMKKSETHGRKGKGN